MTIADQARFDRAIALFDAEGRLLRNYRKTHLWGPDEHLCWSAGYRQPEEGPAFTVQRVNGLPLGLLNCYEAEFPELTRRLALQGAKLVLIPTAADAWAVLSNGVRTDRPYPDVSRTLLPAHAFENGCFVAYVNRCGMETVNGIPMAAYLGNSVICGPHGDLVLAARAEPTLLVADCLPGDYGPTHPAATSYLADRRPEMLRRQAHEAGQRFLHADCSGARDKAGVMAALARGFALPSHFGANLDALYDSLTDLEPEPGARAPCHQWHL